MHGFMNSPALAKLVALAMVEEQVARSPRTCKARPSRAHRRVLRAPATASQGVDSAPLVRPARARPAQ